MAVTNLVDISDADRRIAGKVDAAIAGQVGVSHGLRFTDAGQVMEFAKLMAVSEIGVRKHLRGNPGACLAVVVQALEWRMSPYAVANKSYLVNDQIAWESQLLQAVILQRAPIKGRIKYRFDGEGGKRRCIASAELADGSGVVDYQSPPFDQIQPKNSPLWKSDPDQQMCYQAGRALCRRHFPDVLLGIYAEDEIERLASHGARDITPAKSLADKLTELGNGERPAVEPEPIQQQHDEIPTEQSVDEAQGERAEDQPLVDELHDQARQRAKKGIGALRRFMGGLPREHIEIVNRIGQELNQLATQADSERQT